MRKKSQVLEKPGSFSKIVSIQNSFIIHKDYTLWNENFQLVLPLDIGFMFPADDSVRLLDSCYIQQNNGRMAVYFRFYYGKRLRGQ